MKNRYVAAGILGLGLLVSLIAYGISPNEITSALQARGIADKGVADLYADASAYRQFMVRTKNNGRLDISWFDIAQLLSTLPKWGGNYFIDPGQPTPTGKSYGYTPDGHGAIFSPFQIMQSALNYEENYTNGFTAYNFATGDHPSAISITDTDMDYIMLIGNGKANLSNAANTFVVNNGGSTLAFVNMTVTKNIAFTGGTGVTYTVYGYEGTSFQGLSVSGGAVLNVILEPGCSYASYSGNGGTLTYSSPHPVNMSTNGIQVWQDVITAPGATDASTRFRTLTVNAPTTGDRTTSLELKVATDSTNDLVVGVPSHTEIDIITGYLLGNIVNRSSDNTILTDHLNEITSSPSDHGVVIDNSANVGTEIRNGQITTYSGLTATTGDVNVATVTKAFQIGGVVALHRGGLGELTNIFVSTGGSLINSGTAVGNTGVGTSALSSLKEGASNTAVGNEALYSITDVTGATAVGYQALRSNTSGTGNTAVGYTALYNTAAGANNTAVGNSSLFTNVSGNSNTGVGANAMFGTTGSNNSALGADALYANIGGANNTAIGAGALNLNSSGSNNTATGYNALILGSGSTNTATGAGALFRTTTGSGNVALGYYAGSRRTTQSNSLFIDNQDRGSGVDADITKALIYGTFDANVLNQQVTINGTLHLNGSIDMPLTSQYIYVGSALDRATAVAPQGVVTGVTNAGAFSIDVSASAYISNALAATHGGTGQTSYVIGDILYAPTATTVAGLADVAVNNVLLSGGVGAAPAYGKVGLTTHVSGTLPATSGGTGQTAYAIGALLYAPTTTTVNGLADVATGSVLLSGGVGVAPGYGKVGLTTHISGTLPIANGGTNATSFTSSYVPYFNGTSLVNSIISQLDTTTTWTADNAYAKQIGVNTAATGADRLIYLSASNRTEDGTIRLQVPNATGPGTYNLLFSTGSGFIEQGTGSNDNRLMMTQGSIAKADETNFVVSAETGPPAYDVIATAAAGLKLAPASGQNLSAVIAGAGNFLIGLGTAGDLIVNTDDLVVDTATGMVGVGTAAPAVPLDVVGAIAGSDTITAGTGITATTGNITASAGYVSANTYVGAGTYLSAGSYVNATTYVTAGTDITATNGDINANTVTNAFQINGTDVLHRGLLGASTNIFTGTGGNAIDNASAINNTGNGVGALNGLTSGAANTAIGASAGYSNSSYNQSVFVGYFAGYAHKSDGNTAVGTFAMQGDSSLTYFNTGAGNTALGWGAMQGPAVPAASYDADANTAVGQSVLAAIQSGDYNTGTGYRALQAITSGSRNTAAGCYAANSVTTAGSTTFIGAEAGMTWVGGENTAVGTYAMQGDGASSTQYYYTGAYNSAFGAGALKGSSAAAAAYNADGNSAFGYFAIDHIESGDYNTGSGYYSLHALTDGSYNVSIGYYSGYDYGSGISLTTGSYNTLLGANTATAAATDDYSVVIGANAIGTGAGYVVLGQTPSQTRLYSTPALTPTDLTDVPLYIETATGRIGPTPSSLRFKENITYAPDVSWLYALKPVSFTRKNDPSGAVRYGVIAEEAAEVCPPSIIKRDQDGQIFSFGYSDLIGPMVQVISEQKTEIDSLRSRLAALENKVNNQ